MIFTPMTTAPLFHRHCFVRFVLIFAAAALSAPARAQSSGTTMTDYSAGSEMEAYLRALQDVGAVPLYPWSVRALSPAEVGRLSSGDSTGPWASRVRPARRAFQTGAPTLSGIFNSGFPFGSNDGAVWAGRGLTGVATGGVSGTIGAFSFAVAPVLFRAENQSFSLLANGLTGPRAFNHGTLATAVDLPQRFGDRPYSRLDPGNSYVRLDTKFVTAGVSTANEWIGPAAEFPFLLGNNAPGFPHVFLGTGTPVNLWIAQLHARANWGKLYQSDYSPVTGPTRFKDVRNSGTERLMASGDLVLVPRGMPGLELGIARFFHVPYSSDEPNGAFWRRPLRVLFLKNEYASGDTLGADNQLASIFFRWVFPKSGFEVYGERGYEDQFYDLRDLLQDLDHERSYMLGFQKVYGRDTNGFSVLRGELINFQEPNIARVRSEGFVYVHSILRQGHTNRGQLLGASPGVGAAAGSVLSWSRYTVSGRTTVLLRRIVQDQRGTFQTTGVQDSHASDVIVGAGVERMRFGRLVDLGLSAEAMRDFNRNFSSDVGNLNLKVTARFHP